jgi:hypothetical protein
LNQPMSSPQMMRMLGLSVVAMSPPELNYSSDVMSVGDGSADAEIAVLATTYRDSPGSWPGFIRKSARPELVL